MINLSTAPLLLVKADSPVLSLFPPVSVTLSPLASMLYFHLSTSRMYFLFYLICIFYFPANVSTTPLCPSSNPPTSTAQRLQNYSIICEKASDESKASSRHAFPGFTQPVFSTGRLLFNIISLCCFRVLGFMFCATGLSLYQHPHKWRYLVSLPIGWAVSICVTECRCKWLQPRPWELTFISSEETVTHIHHLNACKGNTWGEAAIMLPLCLSAITCVSRPLSLTLLLLMTGGPWDQASAGPRLPLLLCASVQCVHAHTYIHRHTHIHMHTDTNR